MNLMYSSTRGSGEKVTASSAILKGLADDGGLYVPERIPSLEVPLTELACLSYQETAYEVMRLFLTDYTSEELKNCIRKAYDGKFDTEEIAPLRKVGDQYYLELFHGPTIAFKDMALSILPYLMTTAAKKNHEEREIVILTATSGDTGKAALAGFADVPGTKILVFYPKNGVSAIQERQMVTQKGANTFVVGIRGNFDDAQTGVKALFSDEKLSADLSEEGFCLSSANSINIGRLVPQIVYYVYAYGRMIKDGELSAGQQMDVVVPTGNFGNILAAYYAKKMGLPIRKLICASNENRVLYDFFQTGVYDKNRPFVLTSSPSMDILISSNLERLIYMASGNDSEKCASFMEELSTSGRYEITEEMRICMSDFCSGYTNEEQTREEIKNIYDRYGYVLDPHTAVASHVYRKLSGKGKMPCPAVIVSTASPYKFAPTVLQAVRPGTETTEEFSSVEKLHQIVGGEIPQAIRELFDAPILHDRVIDRGDMRTVLKDCLRKG